HSLHYYPHHRPLLSIFHSLCRMIPIGTWKAMPPPSLQTTTLYPKAMAGFLKMLSRKTPRILGSANNIASRPRNPWTSTTNLNQPRLLFTKNPVSIHHQPVDCHSLEPRHWRSRRWSRSFC